MDERLVHLLLAMRGPSSLLDEEMAGVYRAR